MAEAIDRTSPVPYDERLFDVLRQRVVAGDLAVDERFPSEQELTRDVGLARATVRQTLSRLERPSTPSPGAGRSPRSRPVSTSGTPASPS